MGAPRRSCYNEKKIPLNSNFFAAACKAQANFLCFGGRHAREKNCHDGRTTHNYFPTVHKVRIAAAVQYLTTSMFRIFWPNLLRTTLLGPPHSGMHSFIPVPKTLNRIYWVFLGVTKGAHKGGGHTRNMGSVYSLAQPPEKVNSLKFPWGFP